MGDHEGTKYCMNEASKLRDHIQHLISKARGGHKISYKDDLTLNQCATIIELCDAILKRRFTHAKNISESINIPEVNKLISLLEECN